MGILADILEMMDVAMEAEDITQSAENDANKITGNNPDNEGDDNSDDGDIDLNTDDLLGTHSDNNDGDPTGDDNGEDVPNEDNETDDMNTDEENPDDNMDNPDSENPEGEDPTQNDNKDDEFTKSRKKKIKKGLLQLYDILNDNIKLISEFAPNVSDESTIHTLNSVKSNFVKAKEEIYNIITEEYPNIEYQDLVKKWVALNRIYDLSSKMIETYFDELDKEKK